MTVDSISAEILRDALEYVSEEMAVALRRSAFSPNIRERADHSCAILDAQGRTVGQAEQIPVHIGSMPYGLTNTIEYLRKRGTQIRQGDMYIVNDPYISGTHLNDITVIRPFFWKEKLAGYLANKAHHVDVGGIGPASISPRAKKLSDEGFVIKPRKLMEEDRLDRELLLHMKSKSKYPDLVDGDLHAQVSANKLGERRMLEIMQRHGDEFGTLLELILQNGRIKAEKGYEDLPHGRWVGEDYLELPKRLLRIKVEVEVSSHGVSANFLGTSAQVRKPYNAVLGVTKAAVTFAIKTVLPKDVPLNDGFNQTIHVHAPPGCLVNPKRPAPVAAGNLETSQRIVDAVYKALSKAIPERIPAASHGSMNNLMMGGKSWAFYETIGGGYGGRSGMVGVDGVQVNMTNTMNTPIEVMEHDYPVVFTSYRLRDGSGGRGHWKGGEGIERSFKASARFEVSVIGDRSRISPWGLKKGGKGSTSEYLVRSHGRTRRLKSKDTLVLGPGEELVIRTAGGGGYLPESERRKSVS